MVRFFRFVFLLICLLFVISFAIEALASLHSTKIANVFAQMDDGHDYYILSFSADNPAPNIIVSSKTLPPNLEPRSLLISSNGRWLFAQSRAISNGMIDLYYTRLGQPFSSPPIQTLGWSVSADGQYLFYISIDLATQEETYNFLKLDSQTRIELSVGGLLPYASGMSVYDRVPKYDFPVDGWKFLNKPIVFLSTSRTFSIRDHDFDTLDMSTVDTTKPGSQPKQSHLVHVSRTPRITARISPDGTKLAYTSSYPYNTSNKIVIVDIATNDMTGINANQDETIGVIAWRTDSRSLLYTKRHWNFEGRSDLLHLYQHDVVTGQDKLLPVVLTENSAVNVFYMVMCGNTLFYETDTTLSSASLEEPTGNNLGWGNLLSCAPAFSWEQERTVTCVPVCTPAPRPPSVGLTVNVMQLGLGGGDPVKGQTLYTQQGCASCHSGGNTGPITKGTFTRIVNERLKDPANRGMSAEQYIAQSIIRPDAYVVPGFAANVMIQDYGNRLSMQDLKDLIAYLMEQK